MELRHLRYLVAVAETSTFSGAAQRLGVAQPALTRQLHELEDELGAPLFVSGARRATLTAGGDAAVEVARRLLDDVRRAVERVRLAQRGLAGRCRIVVSRAPMMEGIPGRLVQIGRTRCPDIAIEIVEGELHSMWDEVANAAADIALGQPAPRTYAMLAAETQAQDIIDVVLLAHDHPLAGRASLQLDDLRGEPFLWVGQEDQTEHAWVLMRREILRRGVSKAAMRGLPTTDAVIAAIKAHGGWTTVARRLRPLLPTGFAGVPIEDLAIPIRYCRVWRRADHRPVTQTVLELLRAVERQDRDEREHRAPAKPDESDTFIPARLELRHLRYFVQVVEAGSLGRAGEDLGLTQPALSRQMRDLEYDVAVPLLDRESRGVSLTLAGASLYKDAQTILAAAESLLPSVHRAERGSVGRCLIGIAALPRVGELVSQASRHTEKQTAAVEIEVQEFPSPKLAAALLNSVIDIGVGVGPQPAPALDGIVRIRLASDPLNTALVSKAHPLAQRASATLDDLRDTPLLFVSRDFSAHFHDRVMEAFAAHGHAPIVDSSYEGLNTTWSMVAAGLGWCLAGHSQRGAGPRGTAAIALENFEVPWGIELLYRSDESRTAVLGVIQAIRRSAAGESGVAAPTGPQIRARDTSKAALP